MSPRAARRPFFHWNRAMPSRCATGKDASPPRSPHSRRTARPIRKRWAPRRTGPPKASRRSWAAATEDPGRWRAACGGAGWISRRRGRSTSWAESRVRATRPNSSPSGRWSASWRRPAARCASTGRTRPRRSRSSSSAPTRSHPTSIRCPSRWPTHASTGASRPVRPKPTRSRPASSSRSSTCRAGNARTSRRSPLPASTPDENSAWTRRRPAR